MQDTKFEVSWSEAERLASLRAYDILETDAEAMFDDIVGLAARLCGAPMAAVSMIDETRAWFKAEVGLGLRELERESAFCSHALYETDRLVIPDLAQTTFADHPLVVGAPFMRFYAGQVLRSADGMPLGALCIMDRQPRLHGLNETESEVLRVLASQVMSQLELRRALKAQTAAEDSARRAMEAAEYVGAWDWDIQRDRIVGDERFARLFGVDPQAAGSGVSIQAYFDGILALDADRVRAEVEEAVATGGVFESEYRVVGQQGAARWVVARGQVYTDRSGQPLHLSGVVVDITSRKTMEMDLALSLDALAESDAQLRVMADLTPQIVWSAPADGHCDYFNARWYEFTGTAPGASREVEFGRLFHPDDQAMVMEHWRRSVQTGRSFEVECRLRRHDGTYRWVLGRAAPVRDDVGMITRWFGACTDIDEMKRLDQARELLSRELSHRIKNIFAVVNALIALSARDHPEITEFANGLRTRIAALARAHAFVRPYTDKPAAPSEQRTLHAFLTDLFLPYADEAGRPRVAISGDDVAFDDQAATSVALLFHELATNAAKYGALSDPAGRVDLHTESRGDRFMLSWREEGGPPILKEPDTSGFGALLASLSVENQLGGRLAREWRREGLRVMADLPTTAFCRRRAASTET